ncbi:hypothetical protein ABH958_005630, partial [Bacillus sp. RC250]
TSINKCFVTLNINGGAWLKRISKNFQFKI